jgi:hypothetical protein
MEDYPRRLTATPSTNASSVIENDKEFHGVAHCEARHGITFATTRIEAGISRTYFTDSEAARRYPARQSRNQSH